MQVEVKHVACDHKERKHWRWWLCNICYERAKQRKYRKPNSYEEALAIAELLTPIAVKQVACQHKNRKHQGWWLCNMCYRRAKRRKCVRPKSFEEALAMAELLVKTELKQVACQHKNRKHHGWWLCANCHHLARHRKYPKPKSFEEALTIAELLLQKIKPEPRKPKQLACSHKECNHCALWLCTRCYQTCRYRKYAMPKSFQQARVIAQKVAKPGKQPEKVSVQS